jgi:hypothetical protein
LRLPRGAAPDHEIFSFSFGYIDTDMCSFPITVQGEFTNMIIDSSLATATGTLQLHQRENGCDAEGAHWVPPCGSWSSPARVLDASHEQKMSDQLWSEGRYSPQICGRSRGLMLRSVVRPVSASAADEGRPRGPAISATLKLRADRCQGGVPARSAITCPNGRSALFPSTVIALDPVHARLGGCRFAGRERRGERTDDKGGREA